jgi:hypothetical protein
MWRGRDREETMSASRAMRREEIRQKAKVTTIPMVRMYPRDVVKAMQAERKREMRLYALINRVWGYDELADFFSWLYHTAKANLRNWTAVFQARLIMTLVVWGLAYVPCGEIPGWRHVGKKEVTRNITC